MALPGYMLNAEGSDYHYISISRLHSRRAVPNPSGTPCLQQPAGGGTRTALGQAAQEGSSEAEAEGSELHHASCVLPEEAQGLWGWPESETRIVPDTGNPIRGGSHAQDEVRDTEVVFWWEGVGHSGNRRWKDTGIRLNFSRCLFFWSFLQPWLVFRSQEKH